MKTLNPMELTIENYHKALKEKQITAEGLVQFYVERLEAYDHKGPKINSVIRLNPKVLEEAQALDHQMAEGGFVGPLHGVPVLLKDNVETEGLETTAGSLSLQHFLPESNAFIVKKLVDAGAVILGKANLHEFAIWGETISSILGQTLNPYDLSRTPGGSSGGTGAAVAANFALVGIGTDTINSVRSPAASNSIVGIRPTLGLVSRGGIVPYSYTQDTAGPMARTVADAVRVLEVIRGFDSMDPSTAWSDGRLERPLWESLKSDGLKGKRIGVLEALFGKEEKHQEVNRAMGKALEVMAQAGAELVTLETLENLENLDESLDTDALVNDVSVHLYDLKDHLEGYLNALGDRVSVHSVDDILSSGGYHPGIKDNLMKANGLSTGTDVYNERLILAAKVRERLMWLMAHHRLEAFVYPHQKQLVCKVGASQQERNGVLASVTGFPAFCVPAGYSSPTQEAPLGVPIGLEIMGRPFSEPVLIEIAYAYEQASAVRRMPLSTPPL